MSRVNIVTHRTFCNSRCALFRAVDQFQLVVYYCCSPNARVVRLAKCLIMVDEIDPKASLVRRCWEKNSFLVGLQHFKFRQLSNVQVGVPADSRSERCSLLCVSNEFGLTFVGCKEGEFWMKSLCINISSF